MNPNASIELTFLLQSGPTGIHFIEVLQILSIERPLLLLMECYPRVIEFIVHFR